VDECKPLNDGVHDLKIRVPMREGSYLIWDQRLVGPDYACRTRLVLTMGMVKLS